MGTCSLRDSQIAEGLMQVPPVGLASGAQEATALQPCQLAPTLLPGAVPPTYKEAKWGLVPQELCAGARTQRNQLLCIFN